MASPFTHSNKLNCWRFSGSISNEIDIFSLFLEPVDSGLGVTFWLTISSLDGLIPRVSSPLIPILVEAWISASAKKPGRKSKANLVEKREVLEGLLGAFGRSKTILYRVKNPPAKHRLCLTALRWGSSIISLGWEHPIVAFLSFIDNSWSDKFPPVSRSPHLPVKLQE